MLVLALVIEQKRASNGHTKIVQITYLLFILIMTLSSIGTTKYRRVMNKISAKYQGLPQINDNPL